MMNQSLSQNFQQFTITLDKFYQDYPAFPTQITRILGAPTAHRATHFQHSDACNVTFTKHYLALMHGGQVVSVTWRYSRNSCSWEIRQEVTRTCQALGALNDSAVISHLTRFQSQLHGVTGMYKQHRKTRNKEQKIVGRNAVTSSSVVRFTAQAVSFLQNPRYPGLTQPPTQ
jgi:hypothetical protein